MDKTSGDIFYITELLKGNVKKEALAFMKESDINEDGLIDREEFF